MTMGGFNEYGLAAGSDKILALRKGYFGWQGHGGSVLQWNPDLNIGFGYAPTLLEWYDKRNTKAAVLQKMVVDCTLATLIPRKPTSRLSERVVNNSKVEVDTSDGKTSLVFSSDKESPDRDDDATLCPQRKQITFRDSLTSSSESMVPTATEKSRQEMDNHFNILSEGNDLKETKILPQKQPRSQIKKQMVLETTASPASKEDCSENASHSEAHLQQKKPKGMNGDERIGSIIFQSEVLYSLYSCSRKCVYSNKPSRRSSKATHAGYDLNKTQLIMMKIPIYNPFVSIFWKTLFKYMIKI